MPFAGEEGVVAAGLQDRGQRPFRRRQAAALALERDGRHAAAIGDAPGLHCGAARRAARLAVERPELHALVRNPVEVRRRLAAVLAAAVHAHVAVAEIVGDDEDDVGLLDLSPSRGAGQGESAKRHAKRRGQSAGELFHISIIHGFLLRLICPPWRSASAGSKCGLCTRGDDAV